MAMNGIVVNSIGLLNGPDNCKNHVFSDEYTVDLDPAENSTSNITACKSQNTFSFGIDNCLTLCTNKAACEDDVVDVELNDVIQAICWDKSGTALLAADASGTLHFVNSSGSILFSRKLTPANSTAGIIMICFLEGSDTDHPSIACFLDNGVLLTVENLPLAELSTASKTALSNADLTALFRTIKISNCNTTFGNPERVLIHNQSITQTNPDVNTFFSVIIDDSWALHVVALKLSAGLSTEVVVSLNDEVYIDAVIVCAKELNSPTLALLCSEHMNLTLMDLKTQSLVGKYKTSLMNPLVRGDAVFLMADMVCRSGGAEFDIVFSIGSSAGNEKQTTTYSTLLPGYTLALLNGGHMLLIDDAPVVSISEQRVTACNRYPYSVGNGCSEGAGRYVATWKNTSEITIWTYSPKIWTVLENIRCSRNASGVPYEFYHLSDIIGCLMRPNVPHEAFSLIANRCNSLSIADMLLVLRYVLICRDAPLLSFRQILFAALVAVDSSLPSSIIEQDIKNILKCYQTASSECKWIAIPRPAIHHEEAESVVAQGPTDSDLSEYLAMDDTSGASDVDRLTMDRIYSLTGDNCKTTYLHCVRSGYLDAASIILKVHLHDELPCPADELLLSTNRDVCSINCIVDWMRRDVLSSLHRQCMEDGLAGDSDDSQRKSMSAAENVCELLLQFAKESECQYHHPFDAIAASSMAVQLASSLFHESSARSVRLSAQAMAVHKILELQNAAWAILGLTVSFAVVETGGLKGILDVRLRGIDESLILQDVNDNLLPLMSSYGGDIDEMLFAWINDTLSFSVVVTDADSGYDANTAQTADDEETDSHSSVQVSRLVNVTEAIKHPNLKARAVISLLQMLSAPACLETAPVDSAALFEKLSTMREEVHGMVSASVAESLVEAFRTHKLRVLAAKYSIVSLNLRDPRQFREAIGLIITKTQIPTSVEDALSFAEAYSSAGVDICGLLVRGLVHRILPHHPTAEIEQTDNEDLIRSALSAIPRKKLSVVVENTCSFLMSVVEDLCDNASSASAKLGRLTKKTDQLEFIASINGILQVSTYLLDTKSDEGNAIPEPISSASKSGHCSMRVDVTPNSISSSRSCVASSTITPEYQSDIKRIKKLFTEFSYFVTLNSLWNKGCCVDLIRQTTNKKCDDILKDLDANTSLVTSGHKLEFCNQLLSESSCLSGIRKLCSILGMSNVFALQSMQRYVLAKGSMELGMSFAELIGDERRDVTAACASAAGDDDGEVVLESAISLCAAAARKVQGSCKSSAGDTYHRGSVPNRSQNEDDDLTNISPFVLSSDLLRLSTLSCSNYTLGKTVDLLNACELVSDVSQRLEGHVPTSSTRKSWMVSASSLHLDEQKVVAGSTPATTRRSDVTPFTKRIGDAQPDRPDGNRANKSTKDYVSESQLQSQITGHNFSRDGILLSPALMWDPLMRHLLLETKRREAICASQQPNSPTPAAISDDVEKLIAILQRSENHMLAIRVILCSWHQYASKEQSLHQSLTMLGRKVLSYRDIDTSLAVACLSSIPYEVMVRELRGAVPSIQSDFSRLRTVAQVGEQLANMWEQEELLVVFQSLQTNAKWWHVLSAYGVKIDPRAFQSSIPQQREACVRAVVPALLEKSHGDISLCMEYCSQFDMEAHFASTCYIEYTLLGQPTGASNVEWTEKIKAACSSVEESLIVSSLRSLLPRIHQLDYEKIRYTCSWIIDILSDEELECCEEGVVSSVDDSDEELGEHKNGDIENTRRRDRMTKNASLMEECGTYLNIATFLTSLVIPLDMTKCFPHLQTCYDGLPGEYIRRIPFWELLKTPWVILEPLMNDSAELSSKLTPICAYLNLERDEYYMKRAMNLYMASMNGLTGLMPDSLDGEYDRVLALVGDVVSYIKNPLEQVRVWKWVFDVEKDRYCEIALRSLECALDAFSSASAVEFVGSTGKEVEMAELKKSVLDDVVKHKCKSELVQLDKEHQGPLWAGEESLVHRFSSSLGDGSNLMRHLLDYTIETAWVLQLRFMRNTQIVLCPHDVMNTCHLPVVSEFVSRIGIAVHAINEHHRAVIGDSESLVGTNAPTPTTPLQTVRHAMIGRFLADADIQKDPGDRVMLSANDKVGFSGPIGNAWGVVDSGASPSLAECRRRQDLFKAFAIAVLVASCTDECPRSAYISQLMVVGKGAGARSQRRLTARSKFRAIQGLLFLETSRRKIIIKADAQTDISEDTRMGLKDALDDNVFMRRLRAYLYCLAELQELRLPCSEETLADAIGFDIETTSSSQLHPNPGSLVNTWLHDEGHDSAVCELSRDVLMMAHSTDCRLWCHLWTHMLQRGYVRAVVHTAVALRSCGILPTLLKDSYISSELSECLLSVAADIAERSEQISELVTGNDSSGSLDEGESSFSYKENTANYRPGMDAAATAGKRKPALHTIATITAAAKGNDDSSTSQLSKRIVLVGDNSPWSESTWEECPEDIALSAQRLGYTWHVLSAEQQSLSHDMERIQKMSLRLVVAALKLNLAAATVKQKTCLIDCATLLTTSTSLMACFGGLVCLVRTYHSHQTLYADYCGKASVVTSNDELQEYLIEILEVAFAPAIGGTATSHVNSLRVQCLGTLSEVFGQSVFWNVLSEFCGFELNRYSKTLTYDDPDDSCNKDVARSQRMASLIACAIGSQEKYGVNYVDSSKSARLAGLLMHWIKSR